MYHSPPTTYTPALYMPNYLLLPPTHSLGKDRLQVPPPVHAFPTSSTGSCLVQAPTQPQERILPS